MPASETFLHARNYDLATTLSCGQAFRWQPHGDAWIGVVGKHWVRLQPKTDGIAAETAGPVHDWNWLADYLQADVELDGVLATFPDDEPMRAAVTSCGGLRLLRQDPWESLASFILSSTKQVVQIRQIVALLCERYGEPLSTPRGHPPAFAFPSPAKLASVSESELRRCKMGFRAPYLLAAARPIANSDLNLEHLRRATAGEARQALMRLPGVGPKIADCVLLFAYGFPTAFPLDVWVLKALRELYFPRRRPTVARLRRFTTTHFGPHAGYAQQYLFHYMRIHRSRQLEKAENGSQRTTASSPRRLQLVQV